MEIQLDACSPRKLSKQKEHTAKVMKIDQVDSRGDFEYDKRQIRAWERISR